MEAENRRVRIRAGIVGVFLLAFEISTAGFGAGVQSQTPQPQHAAPAPEMRVDVNHASIDELLKIPGMTHSWAGRIVRFRPYRSKLDLLDRGVVSGEVYNRIKDYIIAHREKQ
jgi:DNA uptake protein ComE-like DNA-binding protein